MQSQNKRCNMWFFLRKLLNIPFPDTCIVCRKVCDNKGYVCNKCKDVPEYISSLHRCRTCLGFIYYSQNGICGNCLAEKPMYSRFISCVKYRGAIAKSLKAYKFYERPDLHIGFSKLACKVLEQENISFDTVVPIPLSKKSFKKRGYNQSALIAKCIAEHFGAEFCDDALIKIKETEKQSTLKLRDRKKNIKGAFSVVDKNKLYGRSVLLVDDIYTTGCTMREAAKMCAPYADDIIAFTIARGILE